MSGETIEKKTADGDDRYLLLKSLTHRLTMRCLYDKSSLKSCWRFPRAFERGVITIAKSTCLLVEDTFLHQPFYVAVSALSIIQAGNGLLARK
jgi:hypothetical protein